MLVSPAVQLEDWGLRPPSCRWGPSLAAPARPLVGSFLLTNRSGAKAGTAVWGAVRAPGQPAQEEKFCPPSASGSLEETPLLRCRIKKIHYINIKMGVPWRPSEFRLCNTPLHCPASSGCLSLPECPALSSSQGGSEVLCGALSAPGYRKAVSQGMCFTGAGRWARESWLQGRI